jgi:MOSC domain-containing protein YiiM
VIEHLFVAAAKGAPLLSVEAFEVVAGMGIVGDRNFGKSRWKGQNLTLVEAEEIESVCAAWGVPADLASTRRNAVVRGVRLNGLVGRDFRIGGVVLRGMELCEPCKTLGGYLSGKGVSIAEVLRAYKGRGGLRCDVVAGGVLRVGQNLITEGEAGCGSTP